MKLQFHWQNRKNLDETLLVLDGEANTKEEGEKWMALVKKTVEEKEDDCPEGWQPLICSDTSKYYQKDKGVTSPSSG